MLLNEDLLHQTWTVVKLSMLFFIDHPPGEFTIPPTHHQAVTPPLVCGVERFNQEVSHRQISPPEKVVDACLQKLSDLHLSKVHTCILAMNTVSLLLSK